MRLAAMAIGLFVCGCNSAASNDVPLKRNSDCGGIAQIPAGRAVLGSGKVYAEEAGPYGVSLDAFSLDVCEVRNRDFADFVEATGYVTIAEKQPNPADFPDIPKDKLVAGSAVFHLPNKSNASGSWEFVPGAFWSAPEGPGSDLDGRMDQPVIHIAYADALAFALWKGGDLPSEAQWEYAARGGLAEKTYEWGDDPSSSKRDEHANTWQGIFPFANTGDDGFHGIAGGGQFEPNGFGLFDMTGNVWEWVKDQDPAATLGMIKGGSYLCAENFCRRYRPAARQPQELDFSTNHIGFRVAYPARSIEEQ